MLQLLKKAIPWMLAALLVTFGYWNGYDKADNKWKQEVHREYVSKVESAKAVQAGMDEIAAKYQGDLEGLEGSTDRIIDDLRNANKRLRVSVKPTSGTTGPDGRCIVDGKVELHESASKALIELTKKADLKEQALQDTIRKLTKKEK